MSFVVEFEQRRTVGVLLFQMKIMYFGFAGCVAAFFTNIHFGSTLFIGIGMLNAVNL